MFSLRWDAVTTGNMTTSGAIASARIKETANDASIQPAVLIQGRTCFEDASWGAVLARPPDEFLPYGCPMAAQATSL